MVNFRIILTSSIFQMLPHGTDHNLYVITYANCENHFSLIRQTYNGQCSNACIFFRDRDWRKGDVQSPLYPHWGTYRVHGGTSVGLRVHTCPVICRVTFVACHIT